MPGFLKYLFHGVSSPDNELVTKSKILTHSNRDRLKLSAANGCRCRKDSHSLPRSANSHIFDLDEFALSGPVGFGPFSVQVFRTSALSKGQGMNGNGKKVMQHAEHSATDRGRAPPSRATIVRCVSPLPARPRYPATSAGSGRSGRIRRSRMDYKSNSPG